MAYGEIKVDSITFTANGSDATVSVSGLVQNPTFSGDITVTGTISGDIVQGGTLVSGATVSGTAGEFGTITGNTAGFTTVTGTTVTGTTVNAVSGVFTTQISGATVTGNTGQFTNITGGAAGFISVTGTTVTGTTANFTSGVFTTQLSGTTITGNTGQFSTLTGDTAGFTTVTGTTVTGTTANFVTVSGTTVTGGNGNFTAIATTTANVTSGVFASGTAAAPSVSVGTTDNGIYSPGTDQVAISTSGTEQIRIDSSGNVGIGSSSPSAKLEVANSASGINDNSTDGQVETIGYIKLGTSNAVATRGPSAAIGHIIKTDSWALQYFSSQIGFFTAQNTVPGTEGTLTQQAVITNEGYFGVGTATPSAGIHVDAPASTSPAIFEINGSETARIDSSARLLVGTSSSSATGTIFAQGSSASATGPSYLYLQRGQVAGASISTGTSLGIINFGDSASAVFAQIAAEGDAPSGAGDYPGRLVFATAADGASSPTERMRITSTGQMRLAGAGITFNGDTAAANELDDYEEGTWTPTVGDVNAGTTNTPSTTSFTSSGVYTKVGNTVTVEGIFNIGDSGTNVTVTDRFSMAGLPYPMPNGDFGGVGTFGGRGATSPLGLNNITFGTIQTAGGSTVMYFSFEKLLSGATQTYDQQLSFSFSYTI